MIKYIRHNSLDCSSELESALLDELAQPASHTSRTSRVVDQFQLLFCEINEQQLHLGVNNEPATIRKDFSGRGC